MKRNTRTLGAIALMAALGLTAAACGDDSSSSSATTAGSTATTTDGSTASTTDGSTATTAAGSTATTAAATGDPLGTKKAAAGAPVKIGVISDGQSAAIDNTDELLAEQATAKWANDYLGGVGGRPIQVVSCETKQDAALAADCGAKMVTEGVAAVLFGVSGQAGSLAKPIQAAGIPLFAWQAADIATDKNATFVFSNGLSAFAQPAIVARDEKLTTAAMIVVDVPGAIGPASSLGAGMLKKAGVADPNIIAVPHEAADFGPQIQAALTKNPQLIHIIGDGPFCEKALTALDTAGYKGMITMISQCVTPATVTTVGAFLKGVQVAYSGTTDATDKDYMLYKAVIAEYASDPSKINLDSNPLGGFGVVASFARLMAGYTGDFSNGDVVKYVKAAPAMPLYLGAGAQFKCDGTAVSILPAICTKGIVAATLSDKGVPGNYAALDPGDLMVLG